MLHLLEPLGPKNNEHQKEVEEQLFDGTDEEDKPPRYYKNDTAARSSKAEWSG